MSAIHRWLGLLFSLFLLIFIPFIIFEETIIRVFHEALATNQDPIGLAGLIAILLASDLVLPVPSSIVSTAAGALLGFGSGTLTCWVGMSLGCVIGYWLGTIVGTPAAQYLVGERELEKAKRLGRQYGAIVLIITRAVPVLAEASVLSAGLAHVSPRLFFIVTGLANLGISIVYSGIGAFAYETNSLLLAFAGAILVPGFAIFITGVMFFRGNFLEACFLWKRGMKEASVPSERISDIVEACFSLAFQYQVSFTNRVFDPQNPLLVRTLAQKEPARQHCLTVFVDDGVMAAWPNLEQEIKGYIDAHKKHLRLSTSLIKIPGGEECKNDPKIIQMIYRQLFELGVDRHSFVIAIGGGAVLDTVGYGAATTHRGVRLVRLPTTVLAQNDSGIGVKTGINFLDSKNFIGAFAPPFAVINDLRFLKTLSCRDRRAGIAEAVKVALINDRDFFEWLESQVQALNEFDFNVTSYMVHRCAELHMNHIAHSGDPFETGNARPLDYGHWSAHKLESLTKHELRHGEAVAIGIAIDSRYASQIGLLPKGTEDRICQLLEKLGFRLWHPVMRDSDSKGKLRLTEGIREFREHLGGDLSITLLADIGRRVEIHEIDLKEIETVIHWLEDRERRS